MMKCKYCNKDATVVSTWSSCGEVIRKRKCKYCGKSFYTAEYEVDVKPKVVFLAKEVAANE